MTDWKIKTHFFTKELLQFSLVTYLILLLAETFKEGFVSYFFNMYILLGIVLILGALVVFTYDKIKTIHTPKRNIFTAVIFSVLITVGGSILIYDRTIILGPIAYVIVGLSALIIMLFSLSTLLSSPSK